jgi:thiol-disulfide isomerase/thioredoxin
MKSSTKQLLIGLLAGAILLACLQVAGLFGVSAVLSSETAQRWIAALILRTPRLPDLDSIPELSRADYEWTIRTLDGETVSFSEFRGKTVFLNIWATWCSPCVMELPSIEKLHRSVDASRVAFVILSREDEESVQAFVRRTPLDLPLYVVDEIPRVFESRGVPTTFIIDSRGAVVYEHTGAARWDGAESVAFLNGLGGS